MAPAVERDDTKPPSQSRRDLLVDLAREQTRLHQHHSRSPTSFPDEQLDAVDLDHALGRRFGRCHRALLCSDDVASIRPALATMIDKDQPMLDGPKAVSHAGNPG